MELQEQINANLGLIIAIVGTGFTFVAAMFGMFLWLRSEANSDRRHFTSIQAEDRKDLLQIAKNMEFEMKDFHYRLLEIEKQRK
jgi:hypothetical protein